MTWWAKAAAQTVSVFSRSENAKISSQKPATKFISRTCERIKITGYNFILHLESHQILQCSKYVTRNLPSWCHTVMLSVDDISKKIKLGKKKLEFSPKFSPSANYVHFVAHHFFCGWLYQPLRIRHVVIHILKDRISESYPQKIRPEQWFPWTPQNCKQDPWFSKSKPFFGFGICTVTNILSSSRSEYFAIIFSYHWLESKVLIFRQQQLEIEFIEKRDE